MEAAVSLPRRVRGARGKRLQRLRSELTERSFAHVCETGGARRCWLRGLIKVAKDPLATKGVKDLGPDPLEDAMQFESFRESLTKRRRPLKPLLMDQKFIAGIGNIYSDEILWGAGLRWDRMSDALTSEEVRRLYRSMMETLQEAVKHRGSSLADEQYVDLFGRPGEYQQFHNVYAREGEACPRCRHVVVRERYADFGPTLAAEKPRLASNPPLRPAKSSPHGLGAWPRTAPLICPLASDASIRPNAPVLLKCANQPWPDGVSTQPPWCGPLT